MNEEERAVFSFIIPHSSFIIYFESVVPPLDSAGQQRRVARVLDVVGDVREVGAARSQLSDVVERAFEPEVCRVRAQAQAVEHESVQAAQHVQRGGRNLAQVGRVGEVVEAVRHHGEPPVDDLDGSNLKVWAEAEGSAVRDRVGDDLRESAAEGRRLEDVFEDAADVHPRALVGIDAQSAMAEVQGSYVVEAEDVVGVAVRDEDGVEVSKTYAQSLLAEVRGRVYQDRLPAVLDEHGDAQALVARVVGRAGLALAAD